jgi:hypothetical protein
MNMRKLSFVFAAILFSLITLNLLPVARAAQDSQSATPAASPARQKAQADISLGDVANQNGATDEAIADYKAAIMADPSDVDAHTKFLRAYNEKIYAFLTPKKIKNAKKKPTKEQIAAKQKKDQAERAKLEAKYNKLLLATYDGWIKKNPQQPMFYWGKAQILEDQDKNPEASALLNKALSIDPSCAPAWADLSGMAATVGDVPTQRADAEKALAADPSDASGVFFTYALTYLTTDPPKYRQLVEDRAAKYPKGFFLDSLLDLAAENAPLAEEAPILEKIYKLYGPSSPNPSNSIDYMMVDLFNLYAQSDPAKALEFAQRMQSDEAAQQAKKAAADKTKAAASAAKKSNAKPAEPFWQTIAEYQKSVVDARALLAQKKYADAQALLEKHALKSTSTFDPSSINQDQYELAMAEALAGSGSSGTQKAYDRIKTDLLPQPDASLKDALYAYGAKLSKTPAQIDDDIWQTRESKAKAMTPFDLKQYVTNKEIKLADYRGQVVLVNFWFPG